MAIITPVHTKRLQNEASSNRTIANLWLVSKMFEKLIRQRIGDIETEMKAALTGESQHKFKKNKSTSSAAMSIQMALAKALEQVHYALMASLDHLTL